VVVTGLGMISSLGHNTAANWEALLAGKSGIDYVTLFDTTAFGTRFAGEVKGFDPADYISRKDARHMDRFAQFAVVAAQEAVKQAKLTIDDSNRHNIGVIIGSGVGGLGTLYEQILNLSQNGPERLIPSSSR
jgi:3-oxoacyl-[acyl-carrier-protein] synthase II